MDRSGIRTGVLSIASTGPGVWFDLGSPRAGRIRAGLETRTPPRGCASILVLLVCSRRCLSRGPCDAEGDRIRSRRRRPTASACKAAMATAGSAISVSRRRSPNSTAARPWSMCIGWSQAAAAPLSVGTFPAVIEVPHILREP